MAAILATSLAVAGVMEPAELERIRPPLEAYLSRIETIRLRYVERWKPGEYYANRPRHRRTPPVDLSPEQRRAIDELAKKREALGEPDGTTTHDLLYAYPSFRHLTDVENRYADGTVRKEHREQYAHAGRLLTINRGAKHAQSDPLGRTAIQLRSPLNAIGWRLPATLKTPLTDLLKFPQVTTQLGSEAIGEIQCIVLRVGPRLPQSIRNEPMDTDEMFYQLWLDPRRSFIPVRIDVYIDNHPNGQEGFSEERGIALQRLPGTDGREHEFLRYRIETAEFTDALDSVRGDRVPFPRRASFDDGAGTILWEVTEVQINLAVSDADFQTAVPDDYTFVENGEIRRMKMAGGAPGRQQRFEQAAQKARESLDASVPTSPSDTGGSGRAWRVGVPLLMGLVIVVLLVLRSRSG